MSRSYELMNMSKVIKCSADGDTDPGRVSEGQAVHVGFGLPALQLPSSFPPSPWPQGYMEHRFGLIGLLGIGRKSAGESDTQGRRSRQDRRGYIDFRPHLWLENPPQEPSPGS